MNFSFPPAPPGYAAVVGARAILVVWSLVGIGIIAHRLRTWKSIKNDEIGRWWLAAGVSYVIILFAASRTPYESGQWILPISVAAIGVSVAGVTLGLCKIYVEGTIPERNTWIVLNLIAAGLWSLLLSPVQSSHSLHATQRTNCRNHLKKIGLAMHNYHDDRESFVPAISGSPPVSWRVVLLPYLDQRSVYNRYRRHSEWNSVDNLPLALEQMNVFSCPANYYPKDANGRWHTAYSMPIGSHTVGANLKGTKLGGITDGASNTLLVVEACGTQIVWTEPRDVNIDSQSAGINLKGSRPGNSAGWLSSYHAHGTQVLLADGSFRFLSQTTDANVLKKLATIDGGDQVDDF